MLAILFMNVIESRSFKEKDFTEITLREAQTVYEDATALLNHVKEEISKL